MHDLIDPGAANVEAPRDLDLPDAGFVESGDLPAELRRLFQKKRVSTVFVHLTKYRQSRHAQAARNWLR